MLLNRQPYEGCCYIGTHQACSSTTLRGTNIPVGVGLTITEVRYSQKMPRAVRGMKELRGVRSVCLYLCVCMCVFVFTYTYIIYIYYI